MELDSKQQATYAGLMLCLGCGRDLISRQMRGYAREYVRDPGGGVAIVAWSQSDVRESLLASLKVSRRSVPLAPGEGIPPASERWSKYHRPPEVEVPAPAWAIGKLKTCRLDVPLSADATPSQWYTIDTLAAAAASRGTARPAPEMAYRRAYERAMYSVRVWGKLFFVPDPEFEAMLAAGEAPTVVAAVDYPGPLW